MTATWLAKLRESREDAIMHRAQLGRRQGKADRIAVAYQPTTAPGPPLESVLAHDLMLADIAMLQADVPSNN